MLVAKLHSKCASVFKRMQVCFWVRKRTGNVLAIGYEQTFFQ